MRTFSAFYLSLLLFSLKNNVYATPDIETALESQPNLSKFLQYLRRDAAVFDDFKYQISSSQDEVRVYAPINQDSPLFLNITRRGNIDNYIPPNPSNFVDRRRSRQNIKTEDSPDDDWRRQSRKYNKRHTNDYETGVRDSLFYDPMYVNLGPGVPQRLVSRLVHGCQPCGKNNTKVIEVSSGVGGVVRTVGDPIRFHNGVIFPVDGVIQLPVSLSETLLEANVSTLFPSVQSNSFMKKLDNYSKITVFAPLNPIDGDVNVEQQVIYDFVGYTPDLESGKTYKAGCGSDLKIERKDGSIFVNGNKIVQPDGILKNGVIHYVDNKKPIMLPSSSTPSVPEGPSAAPSLPAVHTSIVYGTVTLTSTTCSTVPTPHPEKPTHIPPPVVSPPPKPTVPAHTPCHDNPEKPCIPPSHGTPEAPHSAPPHATPDVPHSSTPQPIAIADMPHHPPAQITSVHHIPLPTKPTVEVPHHPAHSTVEKPQPPAMHTSTGIPSAAPIAPTQNTTVPVKPIEHNFELNEAKGSGNMLGAPKALAMGVVVGSIILGM
ncbi:hypothetical protein FPQ18DRAFT_420857 [Pyronema domesticum]|nr:hypothetical protein FPQ18DRAFT_420857 [Pyronema domesticum]